MMDDVFEKFTDFLNTCLEDKFCSKYITEDSIRYTFFYSLIECFNMEPHEVILEFPHTHEKIKRAKVDTYITNLNCNNLAIEFKYHRKSPNAKDMAKSYNAGKIFKDIFRLSMFDATQRLFIYCTDKVMSDYLSKISNGHDRFFNLTPEDNQLIIDSDYLNNKPATFKNVYKKIPEENLQANLRCIWSYDNLPECHKLRIYKII